MARCAVGIFGDAELDGMDAHAKEASDVDRVMHKVFRCFFNVSNEKVWVEKVCRGTHIRIIIDVLFI